MVPLSEIILLHLLAMYSSWETFNNRSGQYVWEDHRPRSGVWKGSNGGEVISFSGCDDDQTSADTSVSFSLMMGKLMFNLSGIQT